MVRQVRILRSTLAATCAALLLAPFPVAAQQTDATPITANVSLVSDYRFRGISQSFERPAIQGGFDWSHASGLYLGNWNSSISGNQYPNGASIEMDFYGGYKFPITPQLTADVGGILYYYPGAFYDGFAPSKPRFTNFEVYGGVTWTAFSAKLYVATTDFFGLDEQVGGRGSAGSAYLDLNYSLEIAPKTTLGLHLGHQKVRHYDALDYTDYRIGVTYDWSGVMLGAAVVGTNADKALYVASNAAGTTRQVGSTGLVLSVSKSF